jgi:hypothetical protein
MIAAGDAMKTGIMACLIAQTVVLHLGAEGQEARGQVPLWPGMRATCGCLHVWRRRNQFLVDLRLIPPTDFLVVRLVNARGRAVVATGLLVAHRSGRLPDGFLGLADRITIAMGLGADREMAEDTSPVGIGNDPDYGSGGRDSLWYRVPLSELGGGKPFSVQATLYYQATPPFYLQDRFCTANTTDTKRLYYLAGKLELGGFTQDWKLRTVTSGPVLVP